MENMESKIKPLPAFYCCYLLRSTIRHASLYIGSSPHPARRLAQHNGQVKGGAIRTSRLSLRPWEMTCVVAGFPSNIAALQFEWAWQNAHLTRHIQPEDRISFPVALTKTNTRTGKTRKKPGRPRTSMVDRLSNLHLLLRTDYFSQWPLELVFFSEDVYRSWRSWCERIDKQLRPSLKVTLDLPQTAPKSNAAEISSAQQPVNWKKADLIGKGGVDGVDPTYAQYRDHFEKLQFLLDEDDNQKCDVCLGSIDIKTDLFSVCTTHQCSSMSHVSCLSEKFLRDTPTTSIIPTQGSCPQCHTELSWSELMRTVSLRIRGEKEINKLLKKKRRMVAATAAESMIDDEADDDDDDDDDDDVADEEAEDQFRRDEDGNEIHGCDEDDDNMSVTSISSLGSIATDTKSPAGKRLGSQKLAIVIEDSEDERL